jgi:MerR family Zn(II)-responsive transcriptional regulator of zntA
MRIGELAEELRINPKTIRYYERIGLLPDPERSSAGYRLYWDEDRARLEFIRKAKCMGLTLEEVGEILTLRNSGQQPCRHVLQLVEEKIETIDEQLRSLTDLRGELVSLRSEAVGAMERQGSVCSLIEGHEVGHN